jgi:dihydropteroate synthase
MQFKLGETLYNGSHPLIMGILNITPDSFYPGSRYPDTGKAIEKALEIVEQGADIIDIGGESSRPGSEQITVEEELARVIPVTEAFSSKSAVPVSIDTCRSVVARCAVEKGACIVNDISALRFDSDMADVISSSGASVILMHMQGAPKTMQDNPQYENVVEDILAFLKERIRFAVSCGIPKERIIVDPGIGFGKNLEHNLAILRDVDRFHETGCAVLVGASRKGMIGKITGAPVEDRLWGTAAIVAHCVIKGVEIHRVHDVGSMRQVCDVAAAIRG